MIYKIIRLNLSNNNISFTLLNCYFPFEFETLKIIPKLSPRNFDQPNNFYLLMIRSLWSRRNGRFLGNMISSWISRFDIFWINQKRELRIRLGLRIARFSYFRRLWNIRNQIFSIFYNFLFQHTCNQKQSLDKSHSYSHRNKIIFGDQHLNNFDSFHQLVHTSE